MENEYAEILATRHEILPGKYETTYEWQGDKRAQLMLDMDFDYKLLPFPLKRIGDPDYSSLSYKYIRTDVSFWWITELKIKISHALWRLNNRLICTAHIWGLVRLNMGEIPSWRQAFENKWSKRK